MRPRTSGRFGPHSYNPIYQELSLDAVAGPQRRIGFTHSALRCISVRRPIDRHSGSLGLKPDRRALKEADHEICHFLARTPGCIRKRL